MHLILNKQQVETIQELLATKHPVHVDLEATILAQVNDFNSEDRKGIVDEARAAYGYEGEIEIDDNAILSRSEEGAYVQAWVWVGKE